MLFRSNLIVFPNPVFRQEGHVTIQLRENFNVASLEIYNAFGETVSTHVLKRESKGQFTVEELSPGIYFIRVFDNEKSFSQKLIIE